MTGILRTILIIIVVYLIVRLIGSLASAVHRGRPSDNDPRTGGGGNNKRRGVPDDVGEYIDYEEVDEEK